MEYASGHALTEMGIAEEMGVSRTPVREALRRLEHEQLVRILPHKGAIVNGVSAEDVREAYLIRQALEGVCARRAAELATDENLLRIERSLDAARKHLMSGEREEASEAADELHRVILAVGGTPRIRRMVASLRDLTRYLDALSVTLPGRLERSIEEHASVLGALRERDRRKVEEVMRDHIASTERDVLAAHRNHLPHALETSGEG